MRLIPRGTAVLLVAVLTAPVLATLPASAAPARPSPLREATARAAALRTEVDALRIQAEQATEAYDEAYDALGRIVTRHLSAQQALDRAVEGAGQTGRTSALRVRSLYMAGGAPALYASVLQGNDLGDVMSRLQALRSVVGTDKRAGLTAGRLVVAQAQAEAELAAASAQQTRLQATVSGRADQVRALLARTDALVAAADARVQQLADEQRQAAEAAAAASAGAILAAAQAARPAAAPTGVAAAAIAAATRLLGKPYVWGGTGPDSFDCSGLTLTAYLAAGIHLPRVASQQWFAGPHVELVDLAPGDLLFWGSNLSDPSTIHHEALYIGNGQMIAAPHAGTFVRVQPVYLNGYFGATRPAAD